MFYAINLHPALPWGDGPELITASVVLGVPHPPGYPLYVLLGHLAYLVPLGNAAFRLNLLSAFCGAFALAILRWSLSLLTREPSNIVSRAAYTAGTLLLGTLTVYFSAARSAEVYALFAVFVSVCILFVFRLWREHSISGHLVWFVAGLAILHHYLILPLLVWLILRVRKWNPVCALIPLVLVFVPLMRSQAGVELDWYHPADLHSLGRLFLGGEFAQNLATGWTVFRIHPVQSVAAAVTGLLSVWGLLLPFVCLGAWSLFRRSRVRAFEYLAVLFAYALFYLFYLVGDREVFLLPFAILATPLLCLGVEWTINAVGRGLSSRGRNLLCVLVLLVPFLQAQLATLTLEETDPMEAFRYSDRVLGVLPPNAVLLAGLHESSQDNEVFPLVYQQVVERRRPDVDVIGTGFLALPWYREALIRRGLELDLKRLPLGKYTSAREWYEDVWRGVVSVVDRPICSTVSPAYVAETRGVDAWKECDSRLLLQLPSFAETEYSPYLPWGTVFLLDAGEK